MAFAIPPEGAIFLGPWEDVDVYCREDSSVQNFFFDNDFSLEVQRFCCRILSSFWEIFPQKSAPLSLKLPQCFTCPSTEELTFFTGSFLPWHKGHSHCILSSKAKGLIITPDNNPWKKGHHQKRPFDILRNIPKDILKGRHLYVGFLSQGLPHPTAHWVCKIKKRKIALVLGDDSFMQITQWQNAELLIKALSRIIVIPRLASEEQISRQQKAVSSINKHLLIERTERNPYESLASSNLRRKQGE